MFAMDQKIDAARRNSTRVLPQSFRLLRRLHSQIDAAGKSYRRVMTAWVQGAQDGSLAIADSICALQTTTRRRPESMMP